MLRGRLNRRHLLGALATLPLARMEPAGAASSSAAPAAPAAFDPGQVRQLARDLAGRAFKAPDESLPDQLASLDYDRYRAIRFLPERALWRDEGLPFQVQFFHRGFFYKNRVDIFIVENRVASPVVYRPDDFSFGPTAPPAAGADLGFSGFRLHAPINKPDYYDEVAVFLGASYFRAVAKNQLYGLSARGLAIDAGEAKGEEFPFFRTFWIEKPVPHASSIVVHALLDSPSASAAFRFTIRPGEETVFDTEMALYPRTELANAGLMPMTSMFLFGPNDRSEVDDFRPQVHDSDGLAIRNGRGESLWRPLHNPRDLQISTFGDLNPRGFGLVQRDRAFADYQDLEASYERRPSLWAEPIGDWGEGAVQLLEIPTREEVHDNIACFWRPKSKLAPKMEHTFTYRLHWGAGAPPAALGRVVRTAIGARGDKARIIVLDFTGEQLGGQAAEGLRGDVSADKAEIRHVVTQPNPQTGGWRLSFEMQPKEGGPVELRAQLVGANGPLSEVWIYRWTA
jgi:glucans biosynthesis protein